MFNFAGIVIEIKEDGSTFVYKPYAEQLQLLEKDTKFTQFKSKRHGLAYITQARPYFLDESANLA